MCLSSISPVGPTYSILTLHLTWTQQEKQRAPLMTPTMEWRPKQREEAGSFRKVACLGSEKICQLGTWECRVSRQKSRSFTLSSSRCMGKQSLRGYAEFYSQTSDPKLHPCDRHVLGSKWLNRSLRWRMETK
jgi:hypothetical protein